MYNMVSFNQVTLARITNERKPWQEWGAPDEPQDGGAQHGEAKKGYWDSEHNPKLRVFKTVTVEENSPQRNDVEPQEYVVQKIVEHFKNNKGTLY